MQTAIEANIAEVRRRIELAAVRAGRDPADVKLVAVSKMHSVESIRLALAAGINVFGENKVQEAEDKIGEMTGDTAEWHLIGHLQSNKARRAVQLFDMIQSIDSPELVKRLERICIEDGRSELPVLVQVDLAGETTKSGIGVDQLGALARLLRSCVCLRFAGLMVLPPYFDDPETARPFFRRLRELRDELHSQGAFGTARGELSMGMTHDLEIAVEEGATIVRVGTAIFGRRAA